MDSDYESSNECIDPNEFQPLTTSRSMYGSGMIVLDSPTKGIEGRSRASSTSSSRQSEDFNSAPPTARDLIVTKGNVQEKRPGRKKFVFSTTEANSMINYHGITLNMAATQGSLPLFVLIWGLAKARKVNLMVPDINGNNPFHHAVLADNLDVITFLTGQTKGILVPDLRLVDSRNESGETPLLRAASNGHIVVLKFLLEEGSDPFVEDHYGNTVFILMAKYSHLWAFHFVHAYVRDRYGESSANHLLEHCDSDGHNCLDWAADCGNVNLIEYLIRYGMNPLRVDKYNRSCLYWAVKSNRLKAMKFLLKCGCDAKLVDQFGDSPLSIGKTKDSTLYTTLEIESRKSLKTRTSKTLDQSTSSNISHTPHFPTTDSTDIESQLDINRQSDATKSQQSSVKRFSLISNSMSFTSTNSQSTSQLITSQSSQVHSQTPSTPTPRSHSPITIAPQQHFHPVQLPPLSLSNLSLQPSNNPNSNLNTIINPSFNSNPNPNTNPNPNPYSLSHPNTVDILSPTPNSARNMFSPVEISYPISTTPRTQTPPGPSNPNSSTNISPTKLGVRDNGTNQSSLNRQTMNSTNMLRINTKSISIRIEPLSSDPKSYDIISRIVFPKQSIWKRLYIKLFHSSSPIHASDMYNISDLPRSSNAVGRTNETRYSVTAVYYILYIFFWTLTMCIPFYVWLSLLAVAVGTYRYVSAKSSETKLKGSDHLTHQISDQNRSRQTSGDDEITHTSSIYMKRILSYLSEYLNASEMYLAAHMSVLTMYTLHWISSLLYGLYHSHFSNHLSSYYLRDINLVEDMYYHYNKPFRFGSFSGGFVDTGLLYVILCFLVLTVGLWLKIVWLQSDPGIIDTRFQDFDKIMDKCLSLSGPPSSRWSCRTSMMLKPIRSKYDASTGLLIARFDHYCVWLNTSIGFKNHRLFIAFLLSQWTLAVLYSIFLIRSIDREVGRQCGIAENMLGSHYFFPTCLLFISICLILSLSVLVYEQISNIIKNQTVNEKINYLRYPWMVDDSKNFHNKFDRGWLSNVLEFFQVPGYYIDYKCLFDIPSVSIHSDNNVDGLTNNRELLDTTSLTSLNNIGSNTNLNMGNNNNNNSATTSSMNQDMNPVSYVSNRYGSNNSPPLTSLGSGMSTPSGSITSNTNNIYGSNGPYIALTMPSNTTSPSNTYNSQNVNINSAAYNAPNPNYSPMNVSSNNQKSDFEYLGSLSTMINRNNTPASRILPTIQQQQMERIGKQSSFQSLSSTGFGTLIKTESGRSTDYE